MQASGGETVMAHHSESCALGPGSATESLLFVLASIEIGGMCASAVPAECCCHSSIARAGAEGAEVVALPIVALDEAFKLFPQAMRSLTQVLCMRFVRVVMATIANHFGLHEEVVATPSQQPAGFVETAMLSRAAPPEIFAEYLGFSMDEKGSVTAALRSASVKECRAGEYAWSPQQRASHLLVLLEGDLHAEFLVDAGAAAVTPSPDVAHGSKLAPGAVIGELSLLVDRTLPLVYRCGTHCRFAALPRDSLQSLFLLQPRTCCLRILQTAACRIPAWLRRSDVLLNWIHIKGGRTLYRKGDPMQGFFVVLSGRVLVLEPHDAPSPQQSVRSDRSAHGHAPGELQIVGSRERGHLCGELDCLHELAHYSGTVRASRDSDLCQMSSSLLPLLAMEFPRAILHFAASITKKRQDDLSGARGLVTIAVVPSDASVRGHEVCARLTAALNSLGKAIHITPQSALADATTYPSIRGPDHPWLARVLAELEERSRWLVYEAEPDITPWTRRCVRQADLVLVAVRFDGTSCGEAPPSPVERYVDEAARRGGSDVERRLLFIHDPLRQEAASSIGKLSQFKPLAASFASSDHLKPGLRNFVVHHLGAGLFSGGSRRLRFTRHYLSQRPWAKRWHHVRADEAADWARCARLLVGQGIGLCLGGGGARGNVHFGVIKAMQELGIPIDVVSGTSFGALAGGMYAMSAAEPTTLDGTVARIMGSVFSTRGMLMDLNFPRTAYFTGKFLNGVLQRTFARRRCEDMLIPFVCTSTDILNFEAKLHHEGPLWRVIRASMSLVGFVPPLPHQERCADRSGEIRSSLLVDGGYTNQYPTAELRQLGAGSVICVKACPEFEPVSTDYGDSVRGGAIAILRKLGVQQRWYQGPDPPPQAEIQERLMFLPDSMNGSASWDLRIEPSIEGYGLLEFTKYRELTQIGYDAALPCLQEWLAGGSRAAQSVQGIIKHSVASACNESGPCQTTLTQTEYGDHRTFRRQSLPKVVSAPPEAFSIGHHD